MKHWLIIILLLIKYENVSNNKDINVNCDGKKFKNVLLAAYFPLLQEDDDKTYRDMNGRKLKSLQEYLDKKSEYITLAMDGSLGVPYGTRVCIPELNKQFNYYLNFEVRDNGTNLVDMGYKRADIFVRTEMDSYDSTVNKKVTLIFIK
ncbi:hypothetical protein FQA39_LY02597 [Lamprigera yunnana]|nr:hypothetical protein FQA39_LY02597 [Lamprigera yunnana]